MGLNEFVELEKGFWDASSRADGDFYRANSTEGALFVFFFGVMDREQCAQAIDQNTTPWAEYRFDDKRLLEMTRDAAVLTYKAIGRHEGEDQEMVMFVSSVYVRQGARWWMARHQQTPHTAFTRDS